MLELFGMIGGIMLVDLVLSGDNALVIGAAAAGLPRRQRLLAIVSGGAGAVVLRITFAAIATLLLQLPLLQAIGGLILLFIAVRLLAGREDNNGVTNPARAEHGAGTDLTASVGFLSALTTIIVADVTMSLDNVLAVGALAKGNLPVLVAGLLLSVALLLVGSALVAALIGRLPWLLDVAALVLAWTGAHMILQDHRLGPVLATLPWSEALISSAGIAVVLTANLVLRRRGRPRQPEHASLEDSDADVSHPSDEERASSRI